MHISFIAVISSFFMPTPKSLTPHIHIAVVQHRIFNTVKNVTDFHQIFGVPATPFQQEVKYKIEAQRSGTLETLYAGSMAAPTMVSDLALFTVWYDGRVTI
jgi:hypothetical protein